MESFRINPLKNKTHHDKYFLIRLQIVLDSHAISEGNENS